MVSQSNLATMRNSVTTMARITHDWRPNVSQSLHTVMERNQYKRTL